MRLERSRDGVGDLAAPVADVGDDRAAGRVEDAAAVGEDQPGALGARDREARPARYEREALHARAIRDGPALRVAHGAA